MLRAANTTSRVMTLEGPGSPVGATLVDALTARERAYMPVHRRSYLDLADVEVDDVRATALAWLSDISRG
jgi:hypothetical protein